MELQNIDYAYFYPPERNIIRIPEKMDSKNDTEAGGPKQEEEDDEWTEKWPFKPRDVE